jgi:hypothetical protein
MLIGLSFAVINQPVQQLVHKHQTSLGMKEQGRAAERLPGPARMTLPNMVRDSALVTTGLNFVL